MIAGPLGRFDPSLIEKLDFDDYRRRCEAAVAALAEQCGLSAASERACFDFCSARIAASDEEGMPRHGSVLALAKMLGINVPSIFEFALTSRRDGSQRYSYSTQMQRGTTLADNLAGALTAALRIMLEGGAPREHGELLADLFRMSFPDPERLRHFSALAPALGLTIHPQAGRAGIELAYNTRLDALEAHEERVVTMLARMGLGERGRTVYRAIYDEGGNGRFASVGARCMPTERTPVASLTVWVERERAETELQRVGADFGASAQVERATRTLRALTQALSAFGLDEDAKLRIELDADTEPTVAVSLLCAAASTEAAEAQQRALLEALREEGWAHTAAAIEATLAALGKPPEKTAVVKQTLRSFGVALDGRGEGVHVTLMPPL